MATDKPQISILMAVYEPRMDWLREQLLSLDAQTYPNIKLYIRDDCSPTISYKTIQSCVQDCIRAFPYEIRRNEKNLGSNKTFERLTEEADGEYFAYCDQDDIWYAEKLKELYAMFQKSEVTMAYCGQQVIDADGTIISEDIRAVRKDDFFLEGEGLAPQLFVKNCIYGCTTLFRAELLRKALPIPNGIAYDHWFSLWAAAQGSIVRLGNPLIRYRLHGCNQSAVFRKVHTKQDYYEQRICELNRRVISCQNRFSKEHELYQHIQRVQRWAGARGRWYQHDVRAVVDLWKGRDFGLKATCFELFLPVCPQPVFKIVIRLFQKRDRRAIGTKRKNL